MWRLFIAIIVSGIPCAWADIYRCDDDGKTIFQSVPCSEGAQSVISKKRSVHGFHETWFESPRYKSGQVVCNEFGCQCGDIDYQQSKDRIEDVLSAMRGLRQAWEQYDQEVRVSSVRHLSNVGEKASEKASLERAGCQVAIYQRIIMDGYQRNSDLANEELVAVKNKKDAECLVPEGGLVYTEGLKSYEQQEAEREYYSCIDRNRYNRQLNEAKVGELTEVAQEIAVQANFLRRPRN